MPHGLFLGSSLATQDRVFYVPSASDEHSDPSSSLPPPTTVALPGRLVNAIKDARVSIVRAFRNNFSLRKLFDKDGCKDLPQITWKMMRTTSLYRAVRQFAHKTSYPLAEMRKAREITEFWRRKWKASRAQGEDEGMLVDD